MIFILIKTNLNQSSSRNITAHAESKQGCDSSFDFMIFIKHFIIFSSNYCARTTIFSLYFSDSLLCYSNSVSFVRLLRFQIVFTEKLLQIKMQTVDVN